MTLSDVGIVFGICSTLVTGGGYVATTVGDGRYLLVAESLQSKVLDYQEKIFLLNQQDILDDDEKDQIEFYKYQVEQLQEQMK